MKVYVAMIHDRHVDPEAYVFSTPDTAIETARRMAAENARGNEVNVDPVDGWLFHATYSVEGDCVWVVEKTLDAAP